MKFNRNRKILILLIVLTTSAWLLLFTQIDYSLLTADPEIFWIKLAGTLGSIVGFVTVTLMLWQNLLGNRHFTRQLTPDHVGITKIHTFIGKYALLLILLHPLLIAYSYLEDLLWIITPDLSTTLGIYIALGRIAFILLFIIYVTSALIRSKMKYRPWLYIHYLTYPIIIFALIHAVAIGSFLESIIVLRALWFTLIAGFIGLIIYRIVMYSGIIKHKFEVVENKKQGPDIFQVKIKPLGKKLDLITGQFLYVQLRHFGESHPFTIGRYDNENGEIILIFQNVGRFTKKFSMVEVGDILMLDGPYGLFTLEGQNEKPKVIFAGGIGVTPFIELVDRYPNEQTYMFYSSRTYDQTINEPLFIEKLGSKFRICLSQEKSNEKHVINGRLNTQLFKKHMKGHDLSKFNYFICGSEHYIKGMEGILEDIGIQKSKVFIEEFTI